MAVVAYSVHGLIAQDLSAACLSHHSCALQMRSHGGVVVFMTGVSTSMGRFRMRTPAGDIAHRSSATYHSLNFFSRSRQFCRYVAVRGGALHRKPRRGVERDFYRSGLADSIFRFSVNLKGAEAMPVQEYLKWKQKVLLGASLKVIAPTGQYDPTKPHQLGHDNRGRSNRSLVACQRRVKGSSTDMFEGGGSSTKNNDFFSRNIFFFWHQIANGRSSPIAASLKDT